MPEHAERLEAALKENDVAQAVLAVAGELDLPDWYFGAGGVAQTVWNVLHGFEPAAGIKDYDLVYFDATDLTVESERDAEAEWPLDSATSASSSTSRTRRGSISGTSSVSGAISSRTTRPARP